MAITPPEYTVLFATDGAADVTEPSDVKKGDGFELGDTTDFNAYHNWVLKELTAWSDFHATTLAPYAAHYNKVWTDESPFGTTLSGLHITWDKQAEKWYAVAIPASTNDEVNLHQSDDGITWSSAHAVSIDSSTPADNITPLRSNGSIVGFCAGNDAYFSSDNDVTNISTGSFNSTAASRDLIYEPNQGVWVVCGAAPGGTANGIWTSPDGSTWTSRYLVASTDEFRSLAHDGAGNAVCVNEIASRTVYAADVTGTWSVATTHAQILPLLVHWCEGSQMFVCNSAGGPIYFSPDGDVWQNVDFNCDMVIPTPTFTYAEVDAGLDADWNVTESDNIAFTNPIEDASERTGENIKFSYLGASGEQYSFGAPTEAATQEGGQGKIVYTYGSDHKLVYSVYGPTSI
jgi:hypothetical protein